jgi:hypothetical protein
VTKAAENAQAEGGVFDMAVTTKCQKWLESMGLGGPPRKSASKPTEYRRYSQAQWRSVNLG